MQLSTSTEALAHTVWVDCRQLAADSEQAEAAHQSAAGAARAELETQACAHVTASTAPADPRRCLHRHGPSSQQNAVIHD